MYADKNQYGCGICQKTFQTRKKSNVILFFLFLSNAFGRQNARKNNWILENSALYHQIIWKPIQICVPSWTKIYGRKRQLFCVFALIRGKHYWNSFCWCGIFLHNTYAELIHSIKRTLFTSSKLLIHPWIARFINFSLSLSILFSFFYCCCVGINHKNEKLKNIFV